MSRLLRYSVTLIQLLGRPWHSCSFYKLFIFLRHTVLSLSAISTNNHNWSKFFTLKTWAVHVFILPLSAWSRRTMAYGVPTISEATFALSFGSVLYFHVGIWQYREKGFRLWYRFWIFLAFWAMWRWNCVWELKYIVLRYVLPVYGSPATKNFELVLISW